MSTEPNARVAEAVDRMNHLAASLGRVLGPDLAAHVLSGAAVNALVHAYGQDRAVEFLRGLADTLEAETPPPIN